MLTKDHVSSGIFPNKEEKTYRAVKPHWSVSQVKSFAESETPKHWYLRNLDPKAPERAYNPHYEIGTLTHKRFELRTEEAFERSHVVVPKGLVRGKAPWEEFREKNKGKTPVRQADWDLSLSMFRAVMEHSKARELLAEGFAEESLFSDYKGIPIKGRTDFRNPKLKCIVDLKTARTASEVEVSSFGGSKSFVGDAYNSRYHWQAAFYIELLRKLTGEEYRFFFITVEKEYPHLVNVFELSRDLLAEGHKEVFAKLEELDKCFRTNTWVGYGDDVKTLDFPPFRKKQSPLALAEKISSSDLIPKEFRTPGNAFLLLDAAKHLDCSILEMANNSFVRNNKLCFNASFLIARANKVLPQGIRFLTTEKNGDVIVTAYAEKNGERIQSSAKLSTARKLWNETGMFDQEDLGILCLKYRAANWLIRAHLPELVSSMGTREEQETLKIKGN
jgi:hypothetical protein